ncbi:MAG: type I secretion system permease/ATPase [Pseudomonadota bacterium]|nr:type I secretion system permease/ATPase [Pseudomonadota bacterium]
MAKSTKEPKDQAKKTPSSNEDTPQTAEVTASAEQTPSDHVPDKWPLEADRLALHSPLAECLRLVAGHYGRRTSFSSLTAGLPIPKEGMSPEIFMRAAERADMNAKLVERPLEALAVAPTLPCILVLKNKQACILWDIEYPDKTPPLQEPGQEAQIHPETRFLVQFPETEEEKQIMGLEQLKALYTDYAFFVRPVARSDDRAGPSEINTARDWFWGVLKKNKRIYQEVVLAAVMINIFALASPLFIMNVYDRVVPNAAFDTLWVLAAGVLIVYVFDFILKNLRAHFLDIAGRKADIKISAQLFEQIMGMTMASRPASAGVLASNMREFEGLRDFFTSATMVTMIDLPFVVMFILMIMVIGGWLAVVPAVAVPLVLVMGWILQKPMRKIIRQSMNESALKNALLFETISGLETIKMQASEGHIQRRWEELTVKASGTAVKSRRISAFALNYAMFIQLVTNVALVITGVYLITEGMISMGALIACVILSGRAMAPLAQVAGLLIRYHQSREALEQLDALMKKDVERPAGKHFISKAAMKGRVEFKEVLFKYPSQSVPALKGVSFVIEPGERVGVIGAVGSGKTTIERLLLNLYQPESGSVQIDGTDVRQIDPGDLRRSIGAVQQDPQLFYGSVRENITMGHETAPERAVLRAAEMAGVMEFLKETQHGLDTPVGERGEALSGGQRQSVAIARALLYDPPIMILDEPTASMDPASENRLKKRLHTLCEGKTTILITHKGAMLGLVDKLILVDRGRIVAFGPKDEVISKLQARQYGTQAENTEV